MTVVVDAREPTSVPFASAAGTSVPGRSLPPARRVIVAGLLVGASAVGTSSVAPTADAAAIHMASESGRTLPTVLLPPLEVADTRSVESRLFRLRDRARLNWGEVGRAVAVSRRTIHNWLGASPIAPRHLTRLVELQSLVARIDDGDPDVTHDRLTRPGPQGRSLLDEFALGSRPIRRVPISTVSAADLLAPESNADEPAPLQVQTRPSTLRGGPIRRRQVP
jgi:hypothetical protein